MGTRLTAIAATLMLSGCSSQQPAPEPSATNSSSEVTADIGKLWVKTDRAVAHSCASEKCGVLNTLIFREAATPLETKDGWSRVTKRYTASCIAGKVEYIKKGDARCTPSNGYIDGQVAEWIRSDQLVADRPKDPAGEAAADEKLVAQSDDFRHYHKQFALIARKLISVGRCTEGDLAEQGGFVKSVQDYPEQPVYFTYCGGMTASNKVYVNAKTGWVM